MGARKITEVPEAPRNCLPCYRGVAAWAQKPWLGLTGFLGATSTDVSSGSSDFIVGGGAAVAVDLKPLNWPALGFLLGYVSESANNGSDIAKRSTGFTGAVRYTGRDDFSVGLEATSRKFARKHLRP